MNEWALNEVLLDVLAERKDQDEKWGEQNHPDGTGTAYRVDAQFARRACEDAAALGQVTWRHILAEEVFEALAETDPERLREELIQVAAVAVSWVEAIDRRVS